MPKVAILGHSHAVTLLDALGDWRKSIGADASGELDERYPASFQNWHSMELGTEVFRLNAECESPAFDDTLVSLLTPNIPGSQELAKFVNLEKGILGTTRLMDSIIGQIADRDVIISCMFGSEYVIYGMLNSVPLYDFAPLDGTPDVYPLDSRYVQILLNSFTMYTIIPAMFALQMRLPNIKHIHVLPPPPLEDPAASPHWEAMGDMIRRHGFARPALRLKWYRLYVDTLKTRLEPVGFTCVTPSDEVATEAGFLRPDYASGLSHGNERYGRVLARQLAEILNKVDHAPV